MENTDHCLADLACADHSGHLVVQIGSHQPVDVHIEFPRPPVSLVREAIHRQKHCHGKLCHRFRGIAGHPQHGYLALSGLNIHMIEPRTSQKQRLHPVFVQPVHHIRIHMIVHKDACRIISLCQKHGLCAEGQFQEIEFISIILCHRFKPDTVVRFCTEKSNPHKEPSFPPDMRAQRDCALSLSLL